MILNSENPALLEEITSGIIEKHPKMAKNHCKMLEELGKYYHDIQAEFHKGLYVFGIYQTLFIENPEKRVTEEEFDYLIEQLDRKHPYFIRMIVQSVFSESILCLRKIIDADLKSISIPNLHRKLEHILTASESTDESDFICNLERIKNKLKSAGNDTVKNYADLRIAHLDKRWETNLKNKSVAELKKTIILIKDYLNAFNRYYTGSAYRYFDEHPNACVNDQAKRATEDFIHLIYGNKKYGTLKNKLMDFTSEIESYEIPMDAQEKITYKIFEMLAEVRNM